MLEARGLTKRYGGLLALDKVSFQLKPGEIVGYLGPNGSGKSTTVNIVVGLLEPSSGTITLGGRTIWDDPIGYKQKIGYVPEEPYLYTHLTATEYLTLVGRLRSMPKATADRKIARLLQLFQLYDSRYSTMAAYSKGMRQRVLLAAALMHNPDLLVLVHAGQAIRRAHRAGRLRDVRRVHLDRLAFLLLQPEPSDRRARGDGRAGRRCMAGAPPADAADAAHAAPLRGRLAERSGAAQALGVLTKAVTGALTRVRT